MIFMLKKVFIGIVISMFSITTIHAINYGDISFSDDIGLNVDSDNQTIVISLVESLKSANSSIDYQFITLTEEAYDNINSITKQITQLNNDCTNVEDTTECSSEIEEQTRSLYSLIPNYSDSWLQQTFDDSASDAIYKVINSSDDKHFLLWVRAKDTSGNYIYQVGTFKEIDNVITAVDDDNQASEEINGTDGDFSSETFDVDDTKITTTKIAELIGVCFLTGGLAVLYIYFRQKNKKNKKDVE